MPGGMGISKDGTQGYLKLNGVICVTYNASGVKGVVKTINGNNPDAAGNVVIPDVSASASGIMTAADKVKLDSISASGSGLGVGQTWQDVTSSRALGVTYYNTTSKPISVAVSVTQSVPTNGLYVNVGTVTMLTNQNNAGGGNGFASFIVPAGDSYKVNSGNGLSIYSWNELR